MTTFAASPAVSPALRQPFEIPALRVGLLGLGQVGQAVARLAADPLVAERAGHRLSVEQALVRNAGLARGCQPLRVTSSTDAFLQGHYDVVIEALSAVEPARTLVARLLARGVPVVSANKALVAAHGRALSSIALARGTSFRYEACALAAVPFLGALAERPLVARVHRAIAIVNGTSNHLLTTMASHGGGLDEALVEARALGLCEPDASRDLDGLDAADKLTLLASLFGWGEMDRRSLEVTGIRDVTATDLRAAMALGGTIKPVVFAERDGGLARVRAFVGPAFLPFGEPLAAIDGALNGIRLDGEHVPSLFFSGPGAGPEVTAATLVDDAIQAVNVTPRRRGGAVVGAAAAPVAVDAPRTPWLLRLTFPGLVPAGDAVGRIVAGAGIDVVRVEGEGLSDDCRWLLVGVHARTEVDEALSRLSRAHRLTAAAWRRLSPQFPGVER